MPLDRSVQSRAPADRGGGFYGACFRDLDGNKIAAFSMG